MHWALMWVLMCAGLGIEKLGVFGIYTGLGGCALLLSLVVFASKDFLPSFAHMKREAPDFEIQEAQDWPRRKRQRDAEPDASCDRILLIHKSLMVASRMAAAPFLSRPSENPSLSNSDVVVHQAKLCPDGDEFAFEDSSWETTSTIDGSPSPPSELSCPCILPPAGSAEFELVIESNFTQPSHPPQCNCGLCSHPNVVIANTHSLQLALNGHFKSDPPEAATVKVVLEYVVVHHGKVPACSPSFSLTCSLAWGSGASRLEGA